MSKYMHGILRKSTLIICLIEQKSLINFHTVDSFLNWNMKQHGANISVDPENAKVATRKVAKQSTDGARTEQGFSKGRHVFEFQFNDRPWGSHCSIGVCSASSNLHISGYYYYYINYLRFIMIKTL